MSVIDVIIGERSSFSAATILFQPSTFNHSLFISYARLEAHGVCWVGDQPAQIRERRLSFWIAQRPTPPWHTEHLRRMTSGSGEPSRVDCQYTSDFYRNNVFLWGRDRAEHGFWNDLWPALSETNYAVSQWMKYESIVSTAMLLETFQ